MAVGVCSGTVLAGCTLVAFYATNNTFNYVRTQESNEQLVLSKGVFTRESDYYIAKTALSFEKEAFQARAMKAASQEGILGQETISNESIQKFLADLEKPDIRYDEFKSVADRDRDSVALNRLISSLLINSKDLKNDDAKEFALKVATVKALADIANSLDGQGSYVGVLNRAKSTAEILAYLGKFRETTGVKEVLKTQLVASCIDTLEKPFDLTFMFKFEHFRIKKMINALNGEDRIDPHSRLFEQPKPLNFNDKVQLAIPGVHLAWKSRVDEIFNKALYDLKDPDFLRYKDTFNVPDPRVQQYKVNSAVLGQAENKVEFAKSNSNYLIHYRFNFGELCYDMARIGSNIYRISHPVKPLHPTVANGAQSIHAPTSNQG